MFVDRSLAYRLESAHAWRGVHYADAQRSLLPHLNIKVLSVAGAQVIYAGPDSPLNQAVALGLSGPVSSTDLDLIEEFYRRHQASPCIDVCPLADPSLLQLVHQRGYRPVEFSSVLVGHLPLDAPPGTLPAHIKITTAGPSEADLWIRTTAQGFEEIDGPSEKAWTILSPNFYSANATCFLAWVDGQPVGGGGMYVHDGVAEFGGASTRAAFRGQGVQTALVYSRLAAALAEGCDLAIAITKPGVTSQRNMERIGFRLAYTKVMVVGPNQ